jgi:hypothetical protein
MNDNLYKKIVNLKLGRAIFGAIILISLILIMREKIKLLVLSIWFLLLSPLMLPITGLPYIALVVLLVLSIIGVLRTDKHDDAKTFNGFVFALFLSIVGIVVICCFSFLFIVR